LPYTTNVIINTTYNYTVYYYTNSIISDDTFTITASGLPVEYYDLIILDNGFSLKFFKESNVPLIVSCKNNIKQTTVSIDVTASKGW
jgi:hypothetical protein